VEIHAPKIRLKNWKIGRFKDLKIGEPVKKRVREFLNEGAGPRVSRLKTECLFYREGTKTQSSAKFRTNTRLQASGSVSQKKSPARARDFDPLFPNMIIPHLKDW
jgi:hypothetical protein